MTTPSTFEDQVATALRRRAAAVAAPQGGRAAIDRRIASRTRNRRIARVAMAAAAAIVMVTGALTVRSTGHDDAKVVTAPGAPAVHIPQLGLPPDAAGTTRITSYSPGRSVFSLLLPTGRGRATDPNENDPTGVVPPMAGAQLRTIVTDASLADVAHRDGYTNAESTSSVNGHPALSYPAFPNRSDPQATVAWQPAPHVVAELTISDANGTEAARSAATLLAAALVELDDATWWTLLNPSPSVTWLGLSGPDGVDELSFYSPHESGGGALLVLDTPTWAPGTFALAAGDGRERPDLFDGTGPEDVDVRGVRGVITDAPPYLPSALSSHSYAHSLYWVEDGRLYRLAFTDAASAKDAVTVADRLSTLTDQQWHALLFPTTVRPDLVAMPDLTQPVIDLGPTDSTDSTGPTGSTGSTGAPGATPTSSHS